MSNFYCHPGRAGGFPVCNKIEGFSLGGDSFCFLNGIDATSSRDRGIERLWVDGLTSSLGEVDLVQRQNYESEMAAFDYKSFLEERIGLLPPFDSSISGLAVIRQQPTKCWAVSIIKDLVVF